MSSHYVYRCYDKDGDLIYIGCTSNVGRRIAQHRKGRAVASRWLSVSMTRHETEGPYPSRADALGAERKAIHAEQPLFNYQQRAGADLAAWMTRQPVALYLIERGHIGLAVETTCACWREVREAGYFDPKLCLPHRTASEAGLTDIPPMPADFFSGTRRLVPLATPTSSTA